MDEPIDPYMGDEHEETASGLGADHDGLDGEDEDTPHKNPEESEDASPYLGDMYE